MATEPWSDEENATIVAYYFEMLRKEISQEDFVKAEYNRRLQVLLPKRSRGSVEYKLQNISAVMLGLGQPWILGYKPASQFQMSLVDAVLAQLDQQPDWFALSKTKPEGKKITATVRDPGSLWIGPPPTFSNEPPPVDLETMAAIARRYDVASRDEANRKLGEAGEEYVLEFEKENLARSGRRDLAQRIVWTSKEEGDGAGFDIASFEPDGRPRLLEIKTTNGWNRTPFHITRNELAVANRERETWHLVRLWNFARKPEAFSIRPPLETHVALTPTTFLASLH